MEMSGCMNYYELLGVSETASSEEIKRAYKMQMKKWHPDINKDEEAVSMSMKINEAKETLLDPVKRKEYDYFLKQKNDNTYKKYSYQKENTTNYQNNYNNNYNEYETRMMTKWEYLKEYMKSPDINCFHKAIVYILVLLESGLCFILKYMVIGMSFICFFLSNIILYAFYYLFPFVVLLLGYLLFIIFTNDINNLFTNHIKETYIFLIILLLYISGFLLPLLGKKLLSPKIFHFLYNKLDINLFKKIVGYKS